jgi:sugar/nucleoside kinase (ribokinase family)
MGNDYFGRSVFQEFENFNVDVSGFKLDSESESLHAHITVDQSDGRRAIILSTNDLPEISLEQVPENYLQQTRLITLDSRISPEIIQMVTVAKSAGAKIMLDAGSVQPHLEDLLPLLDYPIVSYPFVQQYFGHTNAMLAAKLLVESGATIAGVTMGRRGSVLANESQAIEIPAFRIEEVDTTGAGDFYHAGVLFGILQEWDLKSTGQFASAVSALGCLSLGARNHIPDLQEVSRFLEQNDIDNHPLFTLTEDKNE